MTSKKQKKAKAVKADKGWGVELSNGSLLGLRSRSPKAPRLFNTREEAHNLIRMYGMQYAKVVRVEIKVIR